AIIIEDYDKGVLTPVIIEYLVNKAKEKNIPTTVDPKKRNFSAYKNVTLFKPNLKEIKEGLKIDFVASNMQALEQATEKLREHLGAQMIMLTLSEDGVVIKEKNKFTHYPAQIRQIADVSGAGDTVISVATLCLSEGLSAADLAYIANMSGGLVCEEVGVVPINKERLLKELLKNE
ncbi:MAG: PfkB family carbohydrate kinase, partial [Bacteroidales bacterium]